MAKTTDWRAVCRRYARLTAWGIAPALPFPAYLAIVFGPR